MYDLKVLLLGLVLFWLFDPLHVYYRAMGCLSGCIGYLGALFADEPASLLLGMYWLYIALRAGAPTV